MAALERLIDAWSRVPVEIKPVPGADLGEKQYWRFVHWALDRWEELGERVLAEVHAHEVKESGDIRAFTTRAQQALIEAQPKFFRAFDDHLFALLELAKREQLPRKGPKAFRSRSVKGLLRPKSPLRAHLSAVFEHWHERLRKVHEQPHQRPLWLTIGADRSTPDGPGVRGPRGLPAFMGDFDAHFVAAGIEGYCWAASEAIEVAAPIVIRATFDAGYDRLLAGQSESPWTAAHCLDRILKLRLNRASTKQELEAAEEWFDTLNPHFLRWWPSDVTPPRHGFPREYRRGVGVVPYMYDWVLTHRTGTSLPNECVERYVLAVAFLLDRLSQVHATAPAAMPKVAIVLEGTRGKPRALLTSGVQLDRISPKEADFIMHLSESGSSSGSAPMVSALKKRLTKAGVVCNWKGSKRGVERGLGQERRYVDVDWIGVVADHRVKES